MKIDTSRGTFTQVLAASTPQIARIAHRLRERINEVYPEVTEVPRPGEQHAGYGIGSHKQAEIFAYICPLKDYVRLGFYYGGYLPDPAGLLVGEGKRLRHIKIYSLEEAERPEIGDLIKEAVVERQHVLAGKS
jgi:hypothetical protein